MITKLAAKEGRNISRQRGKKIKVKEQDIGIGNGSGAMTFLYKHILEMKRKSRFIFLDTYSMFAILGLGVVGYYFKTKAAPQEAYYIALAVMIYLLYFSTIMGKLQSELIKPYIYLIPEKSIKKVITASLTTMIKPCIDSICMFTAFAVFSGFQPLSCLFFMIAYASSGIVFVSMTILFQRVLGGQPSLLIKAFLGIGLFIMIMAPSVGASVAAAFLLPEGFQFLCTLPYTICCSIFAVLIFALCGNLIDKAEFTGRM